MGKPKPKQVSENDDTEDDSQSLPRTRRRAKLQTTKQEDATSEEENSPAPTPKTKQTTKTRKDIDLSSESPPTEALDTTLAPHLRKRKGGNKRRFTHEYCLTCTHYGRACGGRRDDQDGCAICRDPNREKGEKLRECLWANPASGITTYEEARAAHKEAQVEKRARDKAKAQELKRTNNGQTNTGKSGSLVSRVPVAYGPPPPVRRQLDVVPPLSGTVRSPTYFIPPVLKRPNDDSETITVDTPVTAQSPVMSHLPGINGELGPRIHRPTVIKLRVNNPSDKESVESSSAPQSSAKSQTARLDRQLPPPSKPLSFVPPPIPRVPPYYDFQIQAWRYPSEPGTYVARSDIPSASHPRYESAYGHPPAFTAANSSSVMRTSDDSPFTPTTNRIKTRPLDRTGTPCKKWARTGSDVATTIAGYPLGVKGWKMEEANADDCAVDEIRDDISTSDLSSVIDVDDPREFEKAVRDVGVRSSPSPKSSPSQHALVLKEEQDYVIVHNPDETVEKKKEDGDEEDEDRLQTQINRMVRESELKLSTHSRNPLRSDEQAARPKIVLRATVTTTKNSANPTTLRTRARSPQESCNDKSSSSDNEGPLKRLPLEIRNKLDRNSTTIIRISATETITIKPEHFKTENLHRRSGPGRMDKDTSSLPSHPRSKNSGRSGEENGQKSRHNGANDDSDIVVEDENDDEEEDEEEEDDDDDNDNEETVAGESGDQDVEMLDT